MKEESKCYKTAYILIDSVIFERSKFVVKNYFEPILSDFHLFNKNDALFSIIEVYIQMKTVLASI